MSESLDVKLVNPQRFASSGLERIVLSFAFNLNKERLDKLSQKLPSMKLIAALSKEGLVDEKLLIRFITSAHKIPFIDLKAPGSCNPTEMFRLRVNLPEGFALTHRCVPLQKKDSCVLVAFADPFDFEAKRELEYLVNAPVQVVIATEEDIIDALAGKSAGSSIGAAEAAEIFEETQAAQEAADENAADDEAFAGPVVQLVNEILAEASRLDTSDIHLEPSMRGFEVRYRIDGVLTTKRVVPKDMQLQVTSRLKVLSNMDISERRRPQDGRFSHRMGKSKVDIRSSTVPTPNGEKVVLRLLAGSEKKYRLDALKWPDDFRHRMEELLGNTDGIILVTGPTGSGKTTTLYSCLTHLRQSGRHIVTVEDPIEYRLAGVTQIQIDAKINMTFAAGLRSILRQDPDIIFVGEIRDLETAKIAFNAAQTGHLVLSTLHTNNPAAAVTRLRDLGVESFLISSCLRGVLAQRLVRTVCQKCSKVQNLPADTSVPAGIDRSKLRVGGGCQECSNTGYRGRMGIYSLLTVTGAVRDSVRDSGNEQQIADVAKNYGYVSLFESGAAFVNAGVTTLSEVERVIGVFESNDEAERPGNAMPNELEIDTGMGVLPSRPARAPMAGDGSIELQFDSGAAGKLQLRPGNAVVPPPAKPADPSASGSLKANPAAPAGPSKVMLIDDDEKVRAILAKALRQEQFDVVEASNGKEALEMLQQMTPAIIICDLMMPDLTGREVLQSIKKSETTKRIPIVILSGNDDEETELGLIDAGVDDFISKNASLRRIVSRVRRLVEG